MTQVLRLEDQVIKAVARTIYEALARHDKRRHKKWENLLDNFSPLTEEEISDYEKSERFFECYTYELNKQLEDLPYVPRSKTIQSIIDIFKKDLGRNCYEGHRHFVDTLWIPPSNIDKKSEKENDENSVRVVKRPSYAYMLEESRSLLWSLQHGYLMNSTPVEKYSRSPSLRSFLALICKESSVKVDLTFVKGLNLDSGIHRHFSHLLHYFLPKMINLKELNLANQNYQTRLPQVTNDHMMLIGMHCRGLEVLDVSFHKTISKEGLIYLGDTKDPNVRSGCFNLKKLLIFDTCCFEKDVAKLVFQLPDLEFLGYKETGKVIKTLDKNMYSQRTKLTHVDNRGSKARRLDYSALRCKRVMITAMVNLCPDVTNLKLRVADDDVSGLARLEKVTSVELVFHTGTITTPGPATQIFLQARGAYLDSLAITCQNMTQLMLKSIAENCTNLKMLWFRSNHFAPSATQENLPLDHSYLTKLHTLYLRIGNNELYMVQNFPQDVLPFLIKNAPLQELILAIRSSVINDTYILDLLKKPNLAGLEKFLVVIPGMNSIMSTISLTDKTLNFILNNLRSLKKVGNLLSWSLPQEYRSEIDQKIREKKLEIEVVNKKMTMR
eukprot:TRINITY_DN7_c0_g1_i1.p1 TRINITY_DN7_c0_g1~~TRINITY_DN7_c0_g1_i1.p1  ORF type:complete len:610 (+),score=121.82 TRINITY_DN7_c0_g1_i1:53-1882(+)